MFVNSTSPFRGLAANPLSRLRHITTVPRTKIPPSTFSPAHHTFSTLVSERNNRRLVHENLLTYLNSNRSVTIPNEYQKSLLSPQDLKDHFKAACTTRAIGNVMDEWERRNQAFYSIGSGGHEPVGLIARALRLTDPFAPHYRDNQVLIERGHLNGHFDIEKFLIRGYLCSAYDPNGGRHKLLANDDLNILPNSPTIGPKFPQMVGLAISLHFPKWINGEGRYPTDSICVVSGGDGTVNHPTVLSALNLAKYYTRRSIPCPILFLFTNNEIAISQRPQVGETEEFLRMWGLPYFTADAKNPFEVFDQAYVAQELVRNKKSPAIYQLNTSRLFGHAANPRNEVFSQSEIEDILSNDPLLYTAQCLINNDEADKSECLDIYVKAHEKIERIANQVALEPKFTRASTSKKPTSVRFNYPLKQKPQTMRQLLTATYKGILEQFPNTLFYGQDISPGHYGVGMGLKEKFDRRVFGFPIDEVGLVAFGNGFSMNGFISIIEISYKAYQLEGALSQFNEAQLLRFLAHNNPSKGFIIRSPALGLVKGGPTHTENAFYERLVPQAKVFCFGSGYSAVLGTRAAFEIAQNGHPVVCNEPTAQYFQKDLFEKGDGLWLFNAPSFDQSFQYGDVICYRLDNSSNLKISTRTPEKDRLCLITYGNGVRMSLRVSKLLKEHFDIDSTVIEFPNLFASKQLIDAAFGAENIVIVDECRPGGGPGDSIFTALMNEGYKGAIEMVQSEDTYNPSGPAQRNVYINEKKILLKARGLFLRPLQ